MKNAFRILLFVLISFQFATTYILKEGDVELARWSEEDGKADTQIIDTSENEATEVVAEVEPSKPMIDQKAGANRVVKETSLMAKDPGFDDFGDTSLVPSEIAKPQEKNKKMPANPTGNFAEESAMDQEIQALMQDLPTFDDLPEVPDLSHWDEPLATEPAENSMEKKSNMQTVPDVKKEVTTVNQQTTPWKSSQKMGPEVSQKKVETANFDDRQSKNEKKRFENAPIGNSSSDTLEDATTGSKVKNVNLDDQWIWSEKPWKETEQGYNKKLQQQASSGATAQFSKAGAVSGRLVYFYGGACAYCKRFERDILSKNQVQDFLGGFEVLRINVDEDRKLFDDLRIKTYPAFFVQNDSGKLLPVYEQSNPDLFMREIQRSIR